MARPELDALLPRYQVRTAHAIEVDATPDSVYDALHHVDFSQSRVIRTLFRLRGLPVRAGLEHRPFVTLAEAPNRSVVLGLIGKFWQPTGALRVFTAGEFRGLEPPGTAKAIWSFHIDDAGSRRVHLNTETRVYCPDRRSRVAFRCYWTLIAPFSSWIRREILRLIASHALAGS